MHKLFIAVIVLLISVSAFAAEPSVAALVEAFDHPTLGPAGAVSNLSLKLSDRMSVTLNGNAAPIMAGQDVIGLFFTGKGTYTYRSADPLEATNVRFEVKKASDLGLAEEKGAIALSSSFDQMMLRCAAIELPKTGSGGASIEPQFKAMREDMGRRLGQPATHLLVKQRLDAPQTPVAVAEFSGGGKPTMYVLDGIETRSEQLFSMLKDRDMMGIAELKNFWFLIPISDQRIRGDRRDFLDPLYLLTDIDYTVTGEEKELGRISMTETIQPRGNAQSAFRFDFFSKIYDSSGRPRPFNLKSVKDATGKELSFHHANDSVLVGLPSKAAPNVPFRITFEYDGNFLNLEGGNSAWQLGVAPWFPQPDLGGQYYTIHSLVKVRKPFVAFAPGTTIRRVEEGDYNVLESRVDKPVQFAVVHAGKYHYDEQKFDDGLTVRVASYAQANPQASRKLGNLAWKIIKFYEPWLGPFPFKEFNIIEINELGFGQAPPGTMFITKEAFSPLMGEDNQLFSQGVNERFAHEIAHQYWGHVVKMGSSEEQWVTESFAEYSAALVIKKLKGKGAYDAMIATWRGDAKDAAAVSSIALANRIRIPNDADLQFLYRTYLIYDKGAYVLAALHKQLGDDKFLTFLRSLQGFFEWKFLTTKNMVDLLKRVDPGKDYLPFFEQYYWGTEMPKM